MIVKNEAALIRRCLDSCRPLIDYLLVCDTGSTDGTQGVIQHWLAEAGIPGRIIDDPWQDFAHNRTSALREMRCVEWIDYALMMDADDQLVIHPETDLAAFKSSLDAALYDIDILLDPYRYPRAQLLSNRVPFRYRGVVHEFIEGPPGETTGQLTGVHIIAGVEGSRSSDPQKYRNDALLITRALKDETDEGLRQRYSFYLAQSWRDFGDRVAAHSAYIRRAKMGGFVGETFISLYYAARLREQLGFEHNDIVGSYLQAWETDPTRVESLHAAVRYCHRNSAPHQGYLIGRHALTIPEPSGKLFAEPWIYQWGLLDDFAVAAYWSGHYCECLDATTQLLTENRAPSEALARIEANRDYASSLC